MERAPLIGTKATADFHQGAQLMCCNPDAVYIAATEIMLASNKTPLPRGSHPYREQSIGLPQCVGEFLGCRSGDQGRTAIKMAGHRARRYVDMTPAFLRDKGQT